MKIIIIAISILSILTACSSSDSKSNDSNSISKLKTTNGGKTKDGSLKDLKVGDSNTNGTLKDLNNSLVSVQNSNNSKSTPSHSSVFNTRNGEFIELKIQEPKDNAEKIRINGKTTSPFIIGKDENYISNIEMTVESGNRLELESLISVSGNFQNKNTIVGIDIGELIYVYGGKVDNEGILNPHGGIAMYSGKGKAYNNGTINDGSMKSNGIDSFIYNNNIINSKDYGMFVEDLGYAENNGTINITGNGGIGMYVRGNGSNIINNGDIYLKGKNEIGMEVEDHAKFENNGTIHLSGTKIGELTDNKGNIAIKVNNGGTVTNHGIIEFAK